MTCSVVEKQELARNVNVLLPEAAEAEMANGEPGCHCSVTDTSQFDLVADRCCAIAHLCTRRNCPFVPHQEMLFQVGSQPASAGRLHTMRMPGRAHPAFPSAAHPAQRAAPNGVGPQH